MQYLVRPHDMFYIYRWLGRHRNALVFAEHEKMKHSLSPLSDPIEVLSFFFRSVSGDVGLEFTLIASGSYHIGSSFNRVTSLIKFQIMHEKNRTRNDQDFGPKYVIFEK